MLFSRAATLLCSLLLLLFTPVFCAHYCVTNASGSWRVLSNSPAAPDPRCSGAVLQGEYNATLAVIGWDVMRLVTAPSFPDEVQAYAAGYFEGTMTYSQSINMYNNQLVTANLSGSVLAYMAENAKYIEQMTAALNATDLYWFQVGLVWAQFRGVLDGLNAVASPGKSVSLVQLMLLASQGDLLDLTNYYPSTTTVPAKDWRKMNRSEFALFLAKRTHCSALIKVADDLSNLFWGHATWQSFTFAIRIFKIVTLNFRSTAARTMQFSSYPGALSSTDDFYEIDTGLAVVETSLSVFNLTTYVGNIVPQSVMSWMRVLVANRIATNGPEWVAAFSRNQSSTYNNEWLVLNLNLFAPTKSIQPGTLWLLDQMPGRIEARDMSSILAYGYVASYNVPAIRELFDYGGYPEAIQAQGPQMLDYQTCVRAEIFRRDQTKVRSIESMKWMMQSNDFENDPISNGNPGFAIASRYDLTPPYLGAAAAFGAIDAKVSDFEHYQRGMHVLAFAGPTPQQPQFSFLTSKAAAQTPYQGVPLTFNFSWQIFSP